MRTVVGDGTTDNDSSVTTVSAGVDTVMAGRYDDTAAEIETFIDGTGSGSPTSKAAGDQSNAAVLTIGAQNGGGATWAGDIYAIVLWRSALSDADIATAGTELLTELAAASGGSRLLILGVG